MIVQIYVEMWFYIFIFIWKEIWSRQEKRDIWFCRNFFVAVLIKKKRGKIYITYDESFSK